MQVRGTRANPPNGLIPWFSKTEGNTYATLLHHPFLFKGTPTQCLRNSRKNFWRRCRGGSKANQVPIINSYLLHYIICHLPLVFLSPTSKMFPEKYKKFCLFIRPSSVRLFVCFLVACVLDCLLCHDDSREYQVV